MITADQLKDIQDRADALYRYLDIDALRLLISGMIQNVLRSR